MGDTQAKSIQPKTSKHRGVDKEHQMRIRNFQKTDKKSIFSKKVLVFLEQECEGHIEHLVYFF